MSRFSAGALERLKHGLGHALGEALDAVYPPRCRLCGSFARNGWSCPVHALPREPDTPRCGRCAGQLAPALPEGDLCPACRARAPRFGRAVVVAGYRTSSAAREWVLAFKHGGRPDLAGPLGAVLARRFRERAHPGPAALFVPVPLHPLRRLERGYDQAALLAETAGRCERVTVTRALLRRRATRVQGAPGAPSRTANVRGAFMLDEDPRVRVAGRAVWLVDDVITSGATADECARVLRRAGARSVDVLAIARAG